MRGADLDVLHVRGVGVDAGLPGHDAVAPRVDGRHGNADRNAIALRDFALEGVEIHAATSIDLGHRGVLGTPDHGTPHGDDAPGRTRALTGDFPGDDATEAPTHEGDGLVLGDRHRFYPLEDAWNEGRHVAAIAPELPSQSSVTQEREIAPQQRRRAVTRAIAGKARGPAHPLPRGCFISVGDWTSRRPSSRRPRDSPRSPFGVGVGMDCVMTNRRLGRALRWCASFSSARPARERIRGWPRSLSRISPSIWRIRSRERPSRLPMISSDSGAPPSKPKRQPAI